MKKLLNWFPLIFTITLIMILSPISARAEESNKGKLGLNGVVVGDGSKVIVEAGSLTNPGDVKVNKIVERTETLGTYKVSFEVKGKKVINSTSVQKPVYAVVVFDKSGSMDEKTNKWDNAVGGAKTFASKLLESIPTAQIALVQFSGDDGDECADYGFLSCREYDLYNDATLVRGFQNKNLDDVNFGKANGGTNLGEGLNKAKALLDGITEDVYKYVVVIGDGEPTFYTDNDGFTQGPGDRVTDSTKKYSIDKATALKNSGVEIFSIGYSVSSTSQAAQILKDVSSSDKDDEKIKHYLSADPTQVAQAFNDVATTISTFPAGTGASLNDGIGKDFKLTVGSNTINIGEVTEEGITTTPFYIEIDKDSTTGWHDTNAGFTLTYTKPDGKVGTVSSNVNPQVYWIQPEYSYLVEYYYNNIKDEAKTESKKAFKNAEIVLSEEQKNNNLKIGYKFDRTDPADKLIISDSNTNILKVYYVIDERQTKRISYTVEYYKDGVLQTADTQTVVNEVQVLSPDVLNVNKSNINTTDKYVGYKFIKTIPSPIENTIANNGVIKVYYEKDSFGYTVEYYYSGVQDTAKTENKTAKYETVINEYPNKVITGYRLEKTENLPLTVSEDVTKNVIKVYYVIDERQTKRISYTVEYYKDGVLQTADTQTVVNEVQVLSPDVLNVNKSNINTTDKYVGYKFIKTIPSPIENTIANNGVIKVYYEKDSFNYTVEYYLEDLDGNYVLTDTVIKNAEFNSEALFEIKAYDDYNYDESKTENGTSLVPANNDLVIRLYYNLKEVDVIIHYMINVDGELKPLNVYAIDEDGNVIADFTDIDLEDEVLTGKIGESFSTKLRNLPKHNLDGLYEDEFSEENKMDENEITSTFTESKEYVYVYTPIIEEEEILPPHTGVGAGTENKSLFLVLMLIISICLSKIILLDK